jgi:hypothetical protein
MKTARTLNQVRLDSVSGIASAEGWLVSLCVFEVQHVVIVNAVGDARQCDFRRSERLLASFSLTFAEIGEVSVSFFW